MTVDEQKEIIRIELEGNRVEAEFDFWSQVYSDESVSDEAAVENYLQTTALYCCTSKRWTGIPANVAEEIKLYPPVTAIFQDIIQHFGHGERRQVWNMHHFRSKKKAKDDDNYVELSKTKTAMCHCEPHGATACTTPDFVITGSDQYTPRLTHDVECPLYDDTRWLADGKLDKNMSSDLGAMTTQFGVYARQIFNVQPNRTFVRILAFSEKHIRLFHFDRSGVKYTPLLDYHKNPVAFVRTVLSLLSEHPNHSGFDPSITYSIEGEGDGKHKVGYIKLNKTKCKMRQLAPSFKTWDLSGRGTTCWIVEGKVDGKMEVLLIKDSWISVGRQPEYRYLEDAAAVPGIAKLVEWEDSVETAALRHEQEGAMPNNFHNRVKRKIVQLYYGPQITRFLTRLEPLKALHDTVGTHESLEDHGILHRDISTSNILLNRNPSCDRDGVIIDLDMAIKPSSVRGVSAECRTGTPETQSINVLDSSRKGERTLPHSYLDDLESFFWVFCIIVTGYDSNGKRAEPPPEWIQKWRNADPSIASDAKNRFLSKPPFAPVDASWGKHVQRLFWDLHGFFDSMSSLVFKIAAGRSEMTMEELFSKRVEHYRTVRGYIKKAIDAIEAETPPEKRPAQDVSLEEPEPKRRRSERQRSKQAAAGPQAGTSTPTTAADSP
ncbi:other/FunK1 protein kinase [Coprinopsis cinerea AmutBmut pab1-1]|nr:other/FunK1 protein kinase [Coprinopsis cinerea AmutBmut pab1-1]